MTVTTLPSIAPLLEEELEDSRGTTNIVKIGHDVLAGRLEIGKERGAVTDSLHVINGKGDANRVSHGDQVKNGAVEPPVMLTTVMAFSKSLCGS